MLVPDSPEETDAVGVPPATLSTANLAEVVAVEPTRRSRVDASLGEILPFDTFQLVPPFDVQEPQEGVDAPEIRQSPVESVDAPVTTPVLTVA